MGKLVESCLVAADELAAEGVAATVWDVRVVSPPDPDMLADAAFPRSAPRDESTNRGIDAGGPFA